MEVVYNACHGGFGLSEIGMKLYKEKKIAAGFDIYEETNREDPQLIETVKELGKLANDYSANLQIITIPLEYANCYTIAEYDGCEQVICDPAQLVKYKIRNLVKIYGPLLETLSNDDCRKTLLELTTIFTKPEDQLSDENEVDEDPNQYLMLG